MVYFAKTIQALTLKSLVITKFRESFQLVVCIYLKLILWFMLLYANEVKRVNKDPPISSEGKNTINRASVNRVFLFTTRAHIPLFAFFLNYTDT